MQIKCLLFLCLWANFVFSQKYSIQIGENGKYGIIDSISLKNIVPIEYEYIEKKESFYYIKKGNKYAILDSKCIQLTEFKYDNVSQTCGSGHIVSIDGKYGVIDNNSKLNIPIQYDKIIGNFNGRDFFIIEKDGKKGIIDLNGNIVLSPIYENIENLELNIAYILRVTKNGKLGLIYSNGKQLIQPIFKRIENNGTLLIGFFESDNHLNYEKKFVVFDYLGNILYKSIFNEGVEWFYSTKDNLRLDFNGYNLNYNCIKKRFNSIVLDTNLLINKKLYPKTIQLTMLNNRNIELKQYKDYYDVNSGFGFINKNREWIIPPIFEFSYNYSDNYLQNSIINTDGKIMLSLKSDSNLYFKSAMVEDKIYIPMLSNKNFDFSEGIIPVKYEQYFYFLDTTFSLVMNEKFDEAYPFNQGISLVKKEGKYYYINKQGIPLFNKKFQEGTSFFKNYAVVKINDKYHFLSKNGKLNISDYNKIWPFENGSFLVCKGKLFGLLNENLQTIIPIKFQNLFPIDNNYFVFENQNLKGVLD